MEAKCSADCPFVLTASIMVSFLWSSVMISMMLFRLWIALLLHAIMMTVSDCLLRISIGSFLGPFKWSSIVLTSLQEMHDSKWDGIFSPKNNCTQFFIIYLDLYLIHV